MPSTAINKRVSAPISVHESETSAITSRILTIRGVQVMLDRDLAELYGVETKALNQAVKRNRERFPERFMFPLSKEEFEKWKSQIVTSKKGNRLAASDIAMFNAQHGGLTVRESKAFHDRFLIVDDTSLYLFGASLKDLGAKCFAFTLLNAAEIPLLKARI